MKRTLWSIVLLAVVVAGCAVPAPAQPAAPAAEAPAAIELDVSAAPLPADWMMTAAEPNPKQGGILTTAWGMAPTHFDLHQGGGCAGCAMMYNGLVMCNVNCTCIGDDLVGLG